MVEVAHSIDLELPEKLRDPDYRKRFFLAEASARIAEQPIALRKRRGLNQSELAKRIDTKQPAISRAERADYHNWSFSTLRSIADELDARISVLIQPSEDILGEYEQKAEEISAEASQAVADEADKAAALIADATTAYRAVQGNAYVVRGRDETYDVDTMFSDTQFVAYFPAAAPLQLASYWQFGTASQTQKSPNNIAVLLRNAMNENAQLKEENARLEAIVSSMRVIGIGQQLVQQNQSHALSNSITQQYGIRSSP